MIPEGIICWQIASLWLQAFADQAKVQDIGSAVLDHLISDLDEKTSHALIGIVVPSNGVDHLDAVHECWQSLFDRLWSSIVKWLDELLKSLKILDIVLSLVESLSNSQLNASPL